MMKKYSLITSFFLGTACLFVPTPSQAMDIEDDEIFELCEVGRSKFLNNKAQKRIGSKRLSDKGDYNSSYDLLLHRRFFTPPNENSFFFALDLKREEEVKLLLENTHDQIVRNFAHLEIYKTFKDAFIGEQKARKEIERVRKALLWSDPIQGEIEIEENLDTIIQKLKDAIVLTPSLNVQLKIDPYPRLPKPLRAFFKEYESMLMALQDEEREAQQVWNIFKAQCATEAMYKAYVTHCIARPDHHMLRPSKEAPTGFLNALAHLHKKNLILWTYGTDDNHSLELQHMAGHQQYLSSIDTWEIIHDGPYYTRVVPITDKPVLDLALKKENEYLEVFAETEESKITSDISTYVHKLPMLSPGERAPYNKTYLDVYISRLKELYNKITTKPSGPSPMEIKLATTNKAMKLNVQFKEEAIRRYETGLPALKKEYRSLVEMVKLYDRAYRKDLSNSDSEPRNTNAIKALLHLALYHYDLAKKGRNGSPEAEENLRYAQLFEKKCLQKAKEFVDSIPEQMKRKQDQAQKRLETLKEKNLQLKGYIDQFHYLYSYTTDHDAAQQVVEKHFRELCYYNPNARYVNPEYLNKDPFLDRDSQDVNQLYPNDITGEQFRNQLHSLYKSILYMLVLPTEHQYIFDNIQKLVDFDSVGGKNVAQNLSVDEESVPNLVERRYIQERDRYMIQGRNPNDVRKDELIEPVLADNEDKISLKLGHRNIPLTSSLDVSKQWDGQIAKLKLLESFYYLQSIFSRLLWENNNYMIDRKKLNRKRFAWLQKKNGDEVTTGANTDELKMQHRSNVNTAMTLAQFYGRCIDGISEGLDYIETGCFSSPKITEAEMAKVVELFVADFCKKFKDLSDDPEWKTVAPAFVKARLFLSLPFTGYPQETFHSFTRAVRLKADKLFSPTRLMTLFLKGGTVKYRGKTVTFEPYDADKADTLMYEAYERGLQKQLIGQVLTEENLFNLIKRDPYLRHLYSKALEKLASEEDAVVDTPFFGTRETTRANTAAFKTIHLKKAFFGYLLEKLGWIVNPNSRWKIEEETYLAQLKKQEVEEITRLIDFKDDISMIQQDINEEDDLPEPADGNLGCVLIGDENAANTQGDEASVSLMDLIFTNNAKEAQNYSFWDKLLNDFAYAEQDGILLPTSTLQECKSYLDGPESNLKHEVLGFLLTIYESSDLNLPYWQQIKQEIPDIMQHLAIKRFSTTTNEPLSPPTTGEINQEDLMMRLRDELAYAEYDEAPLSKPLLQDCKNCLEGPDSDLRKEVLGLLQETYQATSSLPYWNVVEKDYPEIMKYFATTMNPEGDLEEDDALALLLGDLSRMIQDDTPTDEHPNIEEGIADAHLLPDLLEDLSRITQDDTALFSARTLKSCQLCLNQNSPLKKPMLEFLQQAYNASSPVFSSWQQLEQAIPEIMQYLAPISSAQRQ